MACQAVQRPPLPSAAQGQALRSCTITALLWQFKASLLAHGMHRIHKSVVQASQCSIPATGHWDGNRSTTERMGQANWALLAAVARPDGPLRPTPASAHLSGLSPRLARSALA